MCPCAPFLMHKLMMLVFVLEAARGAGAPLSASILLATLCSLLFSGRAVLLPYRYLSVLSLPWLAAFWIVVWITGATIKTLRLLSRSLSRTNIFLFPLVSSVHVGVLW